MAPNDTPDVAECFECFECGGIDECASWCPSFEDDEPGPYDCPNCALPGREIGGGAFRCGDCGEMYTVEEDDASPVEKYEPRRMRAGPYDPHYAFRDER